MSDILSIVRQRTADSLRQRTTAPRSKDAEGSKAVEALAAYGEEAIPKLLEVCDTASLADTHVKEAAKSEIDKIKKGP